ncbi:polyprotein [Black grass varicosavirus-like virus]|uniref:Nucleoprotein n=2 Tax=Varicosavirus TaxID=140295 RepID=A0A0D6DU22_9RHAB|nr:polyprotein [Black grass varicosavirus-like virus]CDF65984.1 coat protein [uncultured varicosavirus]CEK42598.1 polyprotein [Black grass varicosavirus-like virus]
MAIPKLSQQNLTIANARAVGARMRRRTMAMHTPEELRRMGFDMNAPYYDPKTGRRVPDSDNSKEPGDNDEEAEDEDADMEQEEEESDEERQIKGRKKSTKGNEEPPPMPKVSARLGVKKGGIKKKKKVLRIRDEMRLTAEQNRGMANQYGGNIDTWTDAAMLGKTTFELKHLDIEELIDICDNVVIGLTSSVTEKIARDIMIAAYNLFSFADGAKVFPERNPCDPQEMEQGYLDTRIEFKGDGEYQLPENLSEEDYVQGCCYIAASTLRLFTKSAENYVRAFEQIKAKYYRFYKDEFPLTYLTPDRRCIEGLKEIYTNKEVYRNALLPFLYSFSELTDPKGMCRLLYEQHLALTGMHAVSLFVKVCLGSHCLPEELSSGLWHRTTRDALREIKDILVSHFLGGIDGQEKGTWMYARLLNDAYFSRIQTKNCKNLVCALAYMASLIGIAGNQNIMGIVHLERMTDEAKAIPIKWATRLVLILSENEEAADGNDVTLDSEDED